MLRALLLALLAAAGGPASAQVATGAAWPGSGVAARYWIDATGAASLERAQAAFDAGQGLPADPGQVMPLANGLAIWYRLDLPQAAALERAMLTLDLPGIDSVELFRRDGAAGWLVQRSGDRVPVNQWPVPYLHPAFAFNLEPGAAQAAYMRVQHAHPVRLNWGLSDARSFTSVSKAWHLALGAYVGFMVLVLLVSVFNTFSWRDSIHLYYAMHVVLIGLSILSLTGLAGEYLWPGNAWWNDKARVVVPAAGAAWAALFVRELVAERGQRLVSWSLLAVSAYGFALMAAFLVLGREHFFRAPSVYLVPSMAVVLAVLAWYARRRPEVGLWVLGGMSLLVVGSLLPMMRNLGWLPASFATQYGTQMGAALEIPLVLAGLYFRSSERRDNLLRMGSLSRTDPLTGVGNHRVLVECLQNLLARGARGAFRGAVMQVHVANLDAIREEFGREAAEAALVRAAECVTGEAAEGDTVAREQGGDLVLVLEGQLTHGQAAEAGRNIIARGLKFSRKLPSQVTLTLQVAAAHAPLPQANAAVLLGMLGRVILDIGADPLRRNLRFLGPDDAPAGNRKARAGAASGAGTLNAR